MGLLDKLWDDTLAGPQPENGLGKLRKYSSLNFRSNSNAAAGGIGIGIGKAESEIRSYGDEGREEGPRVTRSIMIVKPPGYQCSNNGSAPASPAGSTTPVSPVSPFSGGKESFRFRRRSTSDALEKTNGVAGTRSTPSSYDV